MLRIRGLFNLIEAYAIAAFIISSFSLDLAPGPLRVELFSSYLSALASPVAYGLHSFDMPPHIGFPPIQDSQAQYRIGGIALFPSRPYS